MRLLVLSDLHLERCRGDLPRFDPVASKPDLVVLAGDINTGGAAVPWAAEMFAGLPVVYVHGNHEAYNGTIERVHRKTREECEKHPTVHFLQCEEYVAGGVRFLGCTLWTDFQLFEGRGKDNSRWAAMSDAQATMNDYRRIRDAFDYRKIRPSDTAKWHAEQRGWLMRKLNEPFNGKTVVVTHMAPSFESVAPSYAGDIGTAAFASNLDHLVAKADLWVHGHMHDSFDYVVGKCRVVCNPRGYRQRDGRTENKQFDPNLIVEV